MVLAFASFCGHVGLLGPNNDFELGRVLEKLQPEEFSVHGISTQGANVSAIRYDGNIHYMVLTIYGETGRAEYEYFPTQGEVDVSEFRYNRPIYHEEFDQDLSVKSVWRLPVAQSGEKSISVTNKHGAQDKFMSCLFEEISDHLDFNKAPFPDLYPACSSQKQSLQPK